MSTSSDNQPNNYPSKEVKVAEARQQDVGRGIARIDPDVAKELGIATGDIVEITSGRKRTAAKSWHGYPDDRSKGIIRIDGATRRNADTSIDEKVTIGDVIKVRFKQETGFYDKILKRLSTLIPAKYFYLADLVVFVFFSFLYMTFLRVFTFMGYGRSLRISLFLGACTYYFMPDLTVGKGDDLFFLCAALLIILLRAYISRKKAKPSV